MVILRVIQSAFFLQVCLEQFQSHSHSSISSDHNILCQNEGDGYDQSVEEEFSLQPHIAVLHGGISD